MTIDIYNVQEFGGVSPILFYPSLYFFPNYEYDTINMANFGYFDSAGTGNPFAESGAQCLSFNYKDQLVAGGGFGSFSSFLPIDIDVSGEDDYGYILYALENEIIVGISSGTDFFIVKTKFDGYLTSSELGEPLKELSNWRVTDITQFPLTYGIAIHKLKNYYVLIQQPYDGFTKYLLADSSFNIIKNIYTIPYNNTGWQVSVTVTDSGFYTVFGLDGGDLLGMDGPGSGINIVSQLYNQNGDLINVIEGLGVGALNIPLRSYPYKIGNKLFANGVPEYPIQRGSIGRESDIYRVYKSNGRYYTYTVDLPEFIKLIPDVSLNNFGTLLTPRALSGSSYWTIAGGASWSPVIFLCSNYPIGPDTGGGYDYTSYYLGYTKSAGGWNIGRIPF